ncbi:polysaccharide pyruvyl transferase family protein [Noviherbaspirillum autotrophicum]|uniref:Chromosome condensation regulator RCC1 n=1 Tax=Noviherbaspirillum autotrophicum TaxID=709839 RepID=A0A0C2BP71_9BURK|nr:polysaccharide pyruvyl transferase family protein [Noviherbaspirillum autotrophicum]KIF79836.1 chromosome condensation regulator RCC1 [Noviherbaspirillum autotrophicum]
MSRDPDIPVLLFGAFDRHNFGDLLFPHVAAALLVRKKLIFAGLRQRDLRRFGGHRVQALPQLVRQWKNRPLHIIHAGGELLTCDAWQAAVMLLPPDQAQETVMRFAARPEQGREWACRMLGLSDLAPYVVSRDLFPGAGKVICNAVGGMDLDVRNPALQDEVRAKLRAADWIGVRDGRTQALLSAAGIAARLMPDPAVMVAELFGDTIGARWRQGEVARVSNAFPEGYVAVQFSNDFGDDRTLAAIAAQLDGLALSSGQGIVFFRAGAAPWHDDVDAYRRIVTRLRAPSVIFNSLHLWDICALIAGSRVYAGSSLHGRIVAMAYAVPRVSLRYPAQAGQLAKPEAFAAAWDPALPAAVEVHDIAHGIEQALAADPAQLRDTARHLAARYRTEFAALCAGIQ